MSLMQEMSERLAETREIKGDEWMKQFYIYVYIYVFSTTAVFSKT